MQIQSNIENKTANEMWIEFKEAIIKAIDKHIPHKMTIARDNLPWITPQIRKLLWKRDKLSIKVKQQQRMGINNINTMAKWLKALKKAIQREMRKAYWRYVESIIDPSGDQHGHIGRKPFWSIIKHRRTDTVGIKLSPSLIKVEMCSNQWK